MGFLNLFSKPPSNIVRLPQGSFTVDASGKVVASTLPQTFPESQVREIGEAVITTFRSALSTDLPLTEITVHYAALKLTARELRGGAMIFLAPKMMGSK